MHPTWGWNSRPRDQGSRAPLSQPGVPIFIFLSSSHLFSDRTPMTFKDVTCQESLYMYVYIYILSYICIKYILSYMYLSYIYKGYTHTSHVLSLTPKASCKAGITVSVSQMRKFRKIKQIAAWQRAWWCENHLETWASFTCRTSRGHPTQPCMWNLKLSHTRVTEGSHYSKQKSNEWHVASVGSLQQSVVKSRILYKFHWRFRQLLETFGFHKGRHFKTSISLWVNDNRNRREAKCNGINCNM